MVYAVKPGDGSAREQAASCQRVIGGLANICKEYATKRYRSNVMNWGMLPFQMEADPDLRWAGLYLHSGVKKHWMGIYKSLRPMFLETEKDKGSDQRIRSLYCRYDTGRKSHC